MARDEEELDTCRFFSSYPDSETTTVEGHSGDGFRIQVTEIQTHDRVTSDVTTRIIAAPRKATYYGDSRSSSTLPDVVTVTPLNYVEGPRIGCVVSVDAGLFAIGICAGTGNFDGDIHSTFDVRITGSGNAPWCKNTRINDLPKFLQIVKRRKGATCESD